MAIGGGAITQGALDILAPAPDPAQHNGLFAEAEGLHIDRATVGVCGVALFFRDTQDDGDAGFIERRVQHGVMVIGASQPPVDRGLWLGAAGSADPPGVKGVLVANWLFGVAAVPSVADAVLGR